MRTDPSPPSDRRDLNHRIEGNSHEPWHHFVDRSDPDARRGTTDSSLALPVIPFHPLDRMRVQRCQLTRLALGT
jgi:hypothetical protein